MVSKSEIAAGPKKAKNGRYYVKLKTGRTQFLSDDDVKRLREGKSPRASSSKKAKGGKSKSKSKGAGASSSSSSSSSSTGRKSKPKRYLADYL